MTGVLVTGGTGKTGTALVTLLRGNDTPVRIASRNPDTTDPDAIGFDWNDPHTHAAALHDMDRVFLVPPVESIDPLPLVEPFLDQAQRQGVRTVVLLGSAIVLPNAPSALRMAARVRAQPGWAVLRASGFMQNFLPPHPLGTRIRQHGQIRTAAQNGRVGWVDARDIAAAAAAVLTDTAVRSGDRRDYLITGPSALSFADAAKTISTVTNRPVRVEHIDTATQAADYRAAGIPAAFADAVTAIEASVRDGREDQVSTDVLDLTGRPPRTFAAFVREHAHRWAPPNGPDLPA